MSSSNSSVNLAIDGALARVVLNRPEKRNALNDELIAGIKTALIESAQNEDVRVVVVSGAGTDFCSGADLSALQKISGAAVADNVEDARSLLELFLLIRSLPVPVVAAVHGRALAGGCGLATACDLVVASESARFGYPEVNIGFVPAIVTAIVRRNVSEKIAFELLTQGQQISAQQAKSMGLINEVFPDEGFVEAVEGFAQRYERTSKSAVSLTKSLLYQVDGLAFREAIETGVDVNVIARMTEDCQKGIARFLKKQ